jgi:hypothetical protein
MEHKKLQCFDFIMLSFLGLHIFLKGGNNQHISGSHHKQESLSTYIQAAIIGASQKVSRETQTLMGNKLRPATISLRQKVMPQHRSHSICQFCCSGSQFSLA